MRLRARVKSATGATRHLVAHVAGDGVARDGVLPRPVMVEIHHEDDGYFLLHLDEAGESFADTWHMTLEEAKEVALLEFEIEEGGWELVDEAGAP